MRKMGIPLGLSLCLLLVISGAAEERREGKRESYFKRWLEQEVVYIITPEEREVFKKLTTDEEREKFIEQFWLRRDPTPGTVENEFKEEHYRRIAYANQHFASGRPGWMTDRGKIYIKFGPPNEIEAYPSGGAYIRKPWEGGGTTSTFPFEVWRYRYLPGLGNDVEIEFVDPSWSGEYRIAMFPDEKDALLNTAGGGPTWAEQMGLAPREARGPVPGMHIPGIDKPGFFDFLREKDHGFERLQQFFKLQKPPEIKFKDLREAVTAKITYDQLPFDLRQDAILLAPRKYLVFITLMLDNSKLQFVNIGGISRAVANVYGSVTDTAGRILGEFEDVIAASYPQEALAQGLKRKSTYQKALPLDPGLYKLEMVIKDANSGKMGSLQQRIMVPDYQRDRLLTSTLILSNQIRKLDGFVERPEQFVIGDIKVVPSIEKKFQRQGKMGVYLQVYNAAIDEHSMKPAVEIKYSVLQGDKVIKEILDPSGDSVQFFSNQRLVLIKVIPLAGLDAGSYKLRVQIQDRIKANSAYAEETFEVSDETLASAK